MMPNKNQKVTCSVDEFALMMGVSRPSAYAMTEEPGFPLLRVGRRKLVIVSGIERWLEERLLAAERKNKAAGV